MSAANDWWPSRIKHATVSPIVTIEPLESRPAGRDADASLHHSDVARAGSHSRLRRASSKNYVGDVGGAAQRASGRAGSKSRAGPRAGHAKVPALPRGGTG